MKLLNLFLLLFLASCTKDLKKNYNISYDGDKIVLNGYIDPSEGCVVKVSKSVSPSSDVSIQAFEVTDARIYLIEDGVVVTELKSMGKGLFKSDGFTLKMGKKYAIKATAKALESAESEAVTLPDSAQISNLTLRKDSISRLEELRIFNFKLTDNQVGQRNFFKLNMTDQDGRVVDYRYLSNLNINTIECEFDYYDNPSSYGGSFSYFSDKCFDGNSFVADFVAKYDKYTRRSTGLSLELTTTSKEFFDYSKSIRQPFDIFSAFIEPQLIYTNIKNGYGVFYAQNAKRYTFNL
jgi:Domain of unknown function (DUF4249)